MGSSGRVGEFSARMAARLVLLWAGVAIGVAFLATPAKFLAPSLSLPVALDVGRQTFRVYNWVELGLVLLLMLLALGSNAPKRWVLRLSVPVLIVVAQALWLLPALDARVAIIQAGSGWPEPSRLHVVYIAAEALKVLWLIAVGCSGARDVTRSPPRSSWIPFPPQSFPPEQAS